MIASKLNTEGTENTLSGFMAFQKLYTAYSKKFKASMSDFTAREREILHLLALGQNSYEIADSLFISKHTVDTHRKNIYRKGRFNSLRDVILFVLFNSMGHKNTL